MRIIFNAPSSDLLCGVRALSDSLAAQLGPNPTVRVVARQVNLLTPEDLVAIHEQLRDSGELDAFLLIPGSPGDDDGDGDGDLLGVANISVDLLARILIEWGNQNGLR
ncbi:hypothetical protein F5Y17DRAFT_445690 [Xylariaceae sp. FL0594]|nr:hypothetical protein F5Y17DRAFT_445690 [Xylariaceae sp. FL0594]